MTTPFRTSAAPPAPPPPPRFSPLRPIRLLGRTLKRLLWWYLIAEALGEPHPVMNGYGAASTERVPTLFGVLVVVVAGWCVIDVALVMLTCDVRQGYFLFASGACVLARGWLRSAMHLDEPESRDWWREKLA